MERLRKKKKEGKKCNDWRLCIRAAMLVRESGGSRREAGAAGEDAARAHHAYCEASLQAAVKEAERAEQAAEREAESEARVAEADPAPRAPPAAVGEEASIVASSHSVPLDVWQDRRNTVDELLYRHGIATVSSGELADEELELAELLVDDSPAGELLERELQELRRIEARAVGAYGAARSRTPMPRPCAVNRWRPRWRSSRRGRAGVCKDRVVSRDASL